MVRSAKDRAFEGAGKSIGKIVNSIKINDWSSILTGDYYPTFYLIFSYQCFYIFIIEFDDLTKQLEKSKTLIETHGLPNNYIGLLVKL